MKKILSIIISAFLGLSLMCGCADTEGGDNSGGGNNGGGTVNPPDEKVVDYSTYDSFWMRSHDYKTMPVTAFNACPPKIGEYTHNYLATEQTFIDYAEAGVNTMMGLSEGTSGADVMQALDWCAENGISYLLPLGGADNIVNDSLVKGQLMEVKYHDAFGGIMQFDEPGRVQFEKIHSSRDKLIALMPEETQGALWHVNMFPSIANAYQLYFRVQSESTVLPDGGYTFEQYVQDYVSIVKPQVLSYDYYPLAAKFPNLHTEWFYNMQFVRKTAKENSLPFWVYIQTVKYSGGTRIPSCQADISWQVNTALTFGAKGIQYFCGVLPNNNASETFWGAMFDRDGNKTEVYDYVKEANAQLAAVDEILMCSRSKGVIQIGSMPTKEQLYNHEILTEYGRLTSADGEHSLIGCFDCEGAQAHYITNNSLTESEELTLTFDGEVKGYIIQSCVRKPFSGSTLTLNMDAADGVLVVLE